MFANHEKPTETTDTILDQLQRSPNENIVARIGEARYLIPTSTVKLMTWNAIPDFIKDEKSEEAKKMSTLRLGLKALIRPALPEILRKTWGMEVTITPGLNILSWLPKYFTHYFIAFLASKEWQINVQKIESDSGDVFKILSISPHTEYQGNIKGLTAATPDSQPVQGRE